MSEKGKQASPCIDDLRHAEYYQMQPIFDDLYARSLKGETFDDLVKIILMRENILLAYRNIKANTGSNTAGTDKLTIRDIGKLTPEDVVEKVRFIIQGSKHGYRPKPVRRKDIPKSSDPTATRPLGIPCIWDRLVQQCIKQIMEPICEAKFSDNSYGFRPNRSVEHAIQATYYRLQRSNLHYVVEFDIKGFFDHVNHPKLIRQIWTMGIHDKHLIYILKQILKAPIKLPDGSILRPTEGTPQGGIISPLLANIVLNELDHWIEGQWQHNPIVYKYSIGKNRNGGEVLSNGYRAMRDTKLKEMYIVRYADDFRVFCRTKTDANKVMIAVSKWLQERLKLEVSTEKTRIVNVKRKHSEFLGFSIKVQKKGKKHVVSSHMSKKAIRNAKNKLKEQAKRIATPRKERNEIGEIRLYNSIVLGIQNYYRIATNINVDCSAMNREVMTILTNRLDRGRKNRLRRTGRELTTEEKRRFGDSKMLRYVAGSEEPIYPIGYVQHKNPMNKKRKVCSYTAEGRAEIHRNLEIPNKYLMRQMMQQPLYERSVEYADNRISLFSAQWGRCAITGKPFTSLDDVHCHHKLPRHLGGTDAYDNLLLVLKPVHKLIHAVEEQKIKLYLKTLNLTKIQLNKLNKFRKTAGLKPIHV